MTLAQSTFQTGASDALQAVDVYNQTGAGVINSIRDAAGYIKSLDKSLKTATDLSINGISIDSILKINQGQLMINPDAMLKAALKDVPGLMSAYQSLSDAKKVTFTALQDAINLVKVTKGAAQSFLKSAPINDVRAIMGMVMALAEGCPLFPNIIVEDLGALRFLLGKLLHEATTLGLTGLYGAFVGCPKFTDDTHRAVTKGLCSTLYSTCNNGLLLEIAQNGGGPFLLEGDPNLFKNYVCKYQLGYSSSSALWESKQETFFHDFEKILDAFNLIDPTWFISKLNKDINAIHAQVFDQASEDMYELLRHYQMLSCPSSRDMLQRCQSTHDWNGFDTRTYVTFAQYARSVRRRKKVSPYLQLQAEMRHSFHFLK